MKIFTRSTRNRTLIFPAIAAVILFIVDTLTASAQAAYNSGDRVECETTGSGKRLVEWYDNALSKRATKVRSASRSRRFRSERRDHGVTPMTSEAAKLAHSFIP